MNPVYQRLKQRKLELMTGPRRKSRAVKVTPAAIRQMRKLRSQGATLQQIAKQFAISKVYACQLTKQEEAA